MVRRTAGRRDAGGSSSRVALGYGIDDAGRLIGIESVPAGRGGQGSLRCPYCDGRLIARKGRVLAHHFAHESTTCLESRRAIATGVPFLADLEDLPPLERGDLVLLAQMRRWREINASSLRGRMRRSLERLVAAELVAEVPAGARWVNGVGSHRHTDFARRVLRARSLGLTATAFADLQQEATSRRARALERACDGADRAAAADLRLFRARVERARALDLYLLDVRADARPLHKLGVTARAIGLRLAEVARDLGPHFERVEVGVARVWPGRGALELYLKRRYAQCRVEIGRLTEYFDFSLATRASGRGPLTELAALAELATSDDSERG